MTPAIPATRDRPVRRRVAAVTASILAFGVAIAQLVALAHLAETPHHWCDEHGVAEEVEGVRESATSLGQRHAAASLTEAETRSVHDHGGCELAGVRLTTVLASSGPTAHAVHAAKLPKLIAAPAPPARAAALFRLAPKTSPPRA